MYESSFDTRLDSIVGKSEFYNKTHLTDGKLKLRLEL